MLNDANVLAAKISCLKIRWVKTQEQSIGYTMNILGKQQDETPQHKIQGQEAAATTFTGSRLYIQST